MSGVSTFDGGSYSVRPATASVNPGVELIAEWSDSHPLVAATEVNGHRRADVALVPPSDDVVGGGFLWDPATDGARLMANALAWVASPVQPVWLTLETPDSGTVTPGNVDDKWAAFDSTGLAPQHYTTNIVITSDDLSQPTITIPASLDVGNHWRGFVQQPEGGKRYANDSHTFSVQVDCGQSQPQYQWKWDDGAKVVHDIGGNSPSFTIPFLAAGHVGSYWCEVQYDGVKYTSDLAELLVADHLSIAVPPQGAVKRVGESHTFAVAATGGYAPLSYTWRRGVTIVQDGPENSFTIDPLELWHAGEYSVEVADDGTDVQTSGPVTLEVIDGLPAAGPAALALLLAMASLAGAFVVRRRS
jgi:hypothetical protein